MTANAKRIPTRIQPTPAQAASVVCLTCKEPTDDADRYGARRCPLCQTWLGITTKEATA